MNSINYSPVCTINNSSSFNKTQFKPISSLKYFIKMRTVIKKKNLYSSQKNTTLMKTINNSGETLPSTISEANFIHKKNNNLVIFPKLSNKILSKKLKNINIPKVTQLKKVKKENDFLTYFKNHFNVSKNKEKYKINLMDFKNEKKRKELEEKKKRFQNISYDLEDIKKRTKLVKLITYYISPFVENEKKEKMKIIKRNKLNLNNQNMQRKKNSIKIKGDNKEYVKLQNLFRLQRNFSDLGIQTKNKKKRFEN